MIKEFLEDSIGKLRRHRAISLSFLLSFFLILASWIWALMLLSDVGTPLIIHFTDTGGIDQRGNLGDLAVFAITSLIAVIFNFLIALELEERELLWGRIITIATFFISLLIFLGFNAIIGVN